MRGDPEAWNNRANAGVRGRLAARSRPARLDAGGFGDSGGTATWCEVVLVGRGRFTVSYRLGLSGGDDPDDAAAWSRSRDRGRSGTFTDTALAADGSLHPADPG